MGLFFDNKQHLSEMKKIYLLEKKVEKIEHLQEQQAIKGQTIDEEALKREITEEILDRLGDQPSEVNLEDLRRDLLAEIDRELEERFRARRPTEAIVPLGDGQLSSEQLEQIENLIQNNQGEFKIPADLLDRIFQLEEKYDHLQNQPTTDQKPPQDENLPRRKRSTTSRGQSTLGLGDIDRDRRESRRKPAESLQKRSKLSDVDITEQVRKEVQKAISRTTPSRGTAQIESQIRREVEKILAKNPSPDLNEVKRDIRREVEDLLTKQKKREETTAVDTKVIQSVVDETLENEWLPRVQDLLDKQMKKIRRLEKKISRLTLMMADFDDDDDDDDLLDLLPRRRKKRRRRDTPPPTTEPQAPVSPAQSAALESIFNMNQDLQNSL